MKKVLIILSGLLIIAAVAVLATVIHVGDRSGARVNQERLSEITRSPNWNNEKGRFGNQLSRVDGSFFEMAHKYFFGGSAHRLPVAPIETASLSADSFGSPPPSDLRITWFGHSSFLIEIESLNVLVDPVWGERASPFTFAGPKRFYPPLIELEVLPQIDIILISHDHYDHLDYDTVQALKNRKLKWFVPLGLGAHLEHWGVPKAKINEFDWWEEQTVAGVRLVALPARHFSGRSPFFTDQNATLWAGWALIGETRRVFYSGDTALHPEFKDIGERLGPFDVTLMETGAYNQLWSDVHLGPEQAIIAHQLVKGKTMIPVHWGLFDLALHGWTEPAERIMQAAKLMNVDVSLLAPGEQFSPGQTRRNDRWWADQPWETVHEAPAWSTNVESLQQDYQRRLANE